VFSSKVVQSVFIKISRGEVRAGADDLMKGSLNSGSRTFNVEVLSFHLYRQELQLVRSIENKISKLPFASAIVYCPRRTFLVSGFIIPGFTSKSSSPESLSLHQIS
jgi:hypothetical protein